MKRDPIEALVMDYWDDATPPERKRELKQELLAAGYTEAELNDLKRFLISLDDMPVPEPGEELDRAFYRMLAEETAKAGRKTARNGNKPALFWKRIEQQLMPKLGYAFALVFLGWVLGTWVTPGAVGGSRMERMAAEISEMKEMVMLAQLQQDSPSERLKAVTLAEEWTDADAKIVTVLMRTLDSDPNVNVRLATVETLSRFTDNPVVRRGLIESINRQQSPLVQLALAELMGRLQEESAKPELNRLLENKELNYAVRDRVSHVVSML
ncbi:HEAT repeat domain-containing protein [bacterium]|nr:HEAT repeat domain-containing protein [bacterium]